MSGLCSRHQIRDPNCRLCNINPADAIPGWEQKKAEAEAAGSYICAFCGFKYYKTTDACPRCNAIREEPHNAK